MGQVSTSRMDTPTRLSAVICLLVLVWIVTYWLWEPRRAGEPAVTFASEANPAAAEPDPSGPQPALPVMPAAEPQQAAPAPTVQAAVAPRFSEYIVQQGDTSVEVISQRVYGTREHAAAILKANPFADPSRLVPGRTRLRIPEDPGNVAGRVVAVSNEEVEAGQPEATPPPAAARPAVVEYIVTREDTLWDIAEAYYGKGHLWRKIYEANRDVIDDPDRPPVGKTIRIPPLES